MDHKTLSVKLDIEEFTLVKNYCKHLKITPSSLIHELLLEEIGPKIPATIAGHNIIKYDRKRDTFTWYVDLDNRKQAVVLDHIQPEYMIELCSSMSSALASRNELQQKKRKTSVAIPKKILSVRK